jgi:hypothetical protein
VVIALWTGLEEILFHTEHIERPTGKSAGTTVTAKEQEHMKWATILRGRDRLLDKEKSRSVFDKVAFHAGENYRDVVEMCFFLSKDDGEEELETSVNTQREIVRLLERQRC